MFSSGSTFVPAFHIVFSLFCCLFCFKHAFDRTCVTRRSPKLPISAVVASDAPLRRPSRTSRPSHRARSTLHHPEAAEAEQTATGLPNSAILQSLTASIFSIFNQAVGSAVACNTSASDRERLLYPPRTPPHPTTHPQPAKPP